MQNLKPVALIRQIETDDSFYSVRGVAKRIKENEKFVVRVSLVNLSPLKSGEYFIFLDNKKYPLNDLYGGFFESYEDFKGAVCIVKADGETLLPVAYGKFSQDAKSIWEIIESEKNGYKTEDSDAKTRDILSSQDYDDEQIATVDYFKIEREQNRGELNETKPISEQVFAERPTFEREEEKESRASSAEIDGDGAFAKNQQDETYYERVKSQLERLFKEREKETDLENMVANSRWVKVGDGANFYAVGIIVEDNVPKFVCYGLTGSYDSKPSQIKNYSSFIPKSPFNLKGDGYWVMFQDAISGESVK